MSTKNFALEKELRAIRKVSTPSAPDSAIIKSNPPAGKKRIVNMYYNPDDGLPYYEIEA